MKPIARFYFILGIMVVTAVPMFAQTQYRLEFFAAGNFPKDKDFYIGLPQYDPPMIGSHQYSPGVRGGVRMGADFKKHWGEDIIYSYGANASVIVNSTSGSRFAFTVRSHQMAINALWYPTGLDAKKKVFPYLTAGVGGTFFVVNSRTVSEALAAGLGKLHTENVFTFNAGGGIRMQMSKHIGVRLDGRDYMSRTPRFGLPESSDDPAAVVFPTTGVFHQFEASFAFIYYF